MESPSSASAEGVRIPGNDGAAVGQAPLGEWHPAERVSVVIPAYGDQAALDLTLAALSAQTYPAELLEVVVVDDGSDPPLRLPELRPEDTRLVVNDSGRWGIAGAVDTAVRGSSGPIVLRLDSDVIPGPAHVEAHARWHALADYLVVIGKLAFAEVEVGELDPGRVREAVSADRTRSLFGDASVSEDWEIALVRESGGVVTDPVRAFTIANGATISFSRAMYEDCGGMDTSLRLGSDTELGYRMSQHGALFVADAEAEVWHLGASQMKSRRDEGKRYRHPFLSNRVPALRHLRSQPGRAWEVPYVRAVIEVGGARLEPVRATVNSLLSSTISDIEVALVGPWDELTEDRVAPLADPLLDLRLIRETFRGDGRVTFPSKAPEPAPPVPFRLWLEPGMELRREGLAGLIAHADERRLGRVEVTVPTRVKPLSARLDRTAALSRAARLRKAGESFEDLLHELWGIASAPGNAWFEDLMPGSAARRSSLPRRMARRVRRILGR